MRWTTRVAQTSFLLLLAVVASSVAAADDTPKSKWEFEVNPYAWLTGTFGSVTVKNQTAHISASPWELWGFVEDGQAFGAAGYFGVSYDRFFAYADSLGGYEAESVTETIPTRFCTLSLKARDRITFAGTDFAVGYTLGQWSLPYARRPLTLGVLTGTRWMYFGNQLNASGGVVHGKQGSVGVFKSFAWADPLIGLRWELPLHDLVSLKFSSTIGGFHASSELIWGLTGTARFWIPWTPDGVHPYIDLGYRATDFDRSKEAGSINLQFRGPLAGAGVVF